MVNVDSESFLAIATVAALAALLAGLLAGSRLPLPVVVLEIVLGIVIGPELLGLAKADAFIDFFSSLGLGMLFFFAGYEIDFERIRGSPLRLAVLGWLLSLALAYSLGALLEMSGVVLSLVFTGSALATTAIGTLIPVLSDAGSCAHPLARTFSPPARPANLVPSSWSRWCSRPRAQRTAP